MREHVWAAFGGMCAIPDCPYTALTPTQNKTEPPLQRLHTSSRPIHARRAEEQCLKPVDGPWEAYLPKESESRDQARPARQRGSGRYACAYRSHLRGADASGHDGWRVVDRRDRA